MVFFIKQNSELPLLRMRLNRDGRNDYKHIDEYLENAVITFAMKDEISGIYQVANKSAELILQNPCDNNTQTEYYIGYNFTTDDTCKPGIYIGEFKITYISPDLQATSQLIVPISEVLYIHIIDSFIKSDITYIS